MRQSRWRRLIDVWVTMVAVRVTVRVMWGDMGVDVGIDKNKQPLLDPSSRVSKIIKPKTSGNLKSKHNSSLHNFFNGDNSKHIQLILK